MFGDVLGSCENHHFSSQCGEATFGESFKQIGQLFIPTSSHADHFLQFSSSGWDRYYKPLPIYRSCNKY